MLLFGRMAKVLLVDDDQNLRKLYMDELTLMGAQVFAATTGQEGLEKALVLNPDIILLDVILPEKIGLTVLKELKTDERTKNIPVVVLSNFDQGDNPKKAVELGAAAFFSKQKLTPAQIAKEALSLLA